MGELMKKIRVFGGKTQFQLAQSTGVHPSRISVIERGLATPSIREMMAISNTLGILPEEVFGLDAVVGKLIASGKKGTKD